jgi:hypothetical protein
VATSLVLVDTEKVLNKLNISLRTPSPPSSRPSSRSSEFVPETPRTIAQLRKQSSRMIDLLDRLSQSPRSPLKSVVHRIIKGHYLTLHTLVLLMHDNTNLRIASERSAKKGTRSTKHLPCEEGLTVEEALQLAAQLNLPVEEDVVESQTEVELPNQPTRPAARAPPRCSGCWEFGHRINHCKNREQ